GQRQRVALARALAVEPQVLLLDEPFGALDAKVRIELRAWLRRLHDEIHLTSVFVTHDQDEALELADRVAVVNRGKIEQVGPPDEVFHSPKTPFVMNFLGQVNQFRGRCERGAICLEGAARPTASRFYEKADVKLDERRPATIFVRPHDFEISRAPVEGRLSILATVRRIHSAGNRVRVEMLAETGETLIAETTHQERATLAMETGDSYYMTPRSLRIFADGSDSRIEELTN
ncbi:MAG: ATP-binding cassette domain-containing protein, partial [Thermoguttaceae bacterium]|nr:ATP-binding cassette domain-containing protein [Thermoguttaceae bacterium]